MVFCNRVELTIFVVSLPHCFIAENKLTFTSGVAWRILKHQVTVNRSVEDLLIDKSGFLFFFKSQVKQGRELGFFDNCIWI